VAAAPGGPAGPLAGVRVLDFSEYIAGPYAGMVLADYGADVVKVEPLRGDFWRSNNPLAPFESRGFMSVNRGKRSLSIDLKQPAARGVVARAARWADVVIVNYRPGVAARLGVDYATLSAVNPRLVYADNTAFGPAGPYAAKPGMDLIAQAMTGIADFEGGSGTPHPIGFTAPIDLCAGLFLVGAIGAALYHRERTGRGQHIATSLFATALAIQYRPLFSIESRDRAAREQRLAARAAGAGAVPAGGDAAIERPGGDVEQPWYRIHATRDGHVALACGNNVLRRAAAAVVGIEDPRLATDAWDPSRVDAAAARALLAAIEARLRTRTTADWCDAFDAAGVPCGPVRASAELFEDPQVRLDGLMPEVEHPRFGTLRMPRAPVSMSDSPTGTRVPPPLLGQHTREVLALFGHAPDEIDGLLAAGIVREPPVVDAVQGTREGG
jgi:formyl-CoA transferase